MLANRFQSHNSIVEYIEPKIGHFKVANSKSTRTNKNDI